LDSAEVAGEEKLLSDHDLSTTRSRLADQHFMVSEGFRLGGKGAGLEQRETRHGRSLAGECAVFKNQRR
jgi:hypothetical protein